jgi:hypothetical protein
MEQYRMTTLMGQYFKEINEKLCTGPGRTNFKFLYWPITANFWPQSNFIDNTYFLKSLMIWNGKNYLKLMSF